MFPAGNCRIRFRISGYRTKAHGITSQKKKRFCKSPDADLRSLKINEQIRDDVPFFGDGVESMQPWFTFSQVGVREVKTQTGHAGLKHFM